jgi:hypothetical protein
MSEARLAVRAKVSWRAAILIGPGKIVPAKIIDFSRGGLKLQCGVPLKDGETYQIMMEVPKKLDASSRTKVTCKAKCIYSLLSGDDYCAGMKYFEVPSQFVSLLQNWHG